VYKRLGGKEIHIVTTDVPGAAEFDAGHSNTIHRLNLKRVAWLRPESLAMYARLFFKSLALALTHRFDAVHAFRALPEGLVAWAVARLTFRPVVIYAHGEELTTWGQGWKYKAMRFALRHADQVIANSDYTRDELIGMGIDPTRIVPINPGVDVSVFHPGLTCGDLKAGIGLTPEQKLILSVGRLSRRKGFDMVIRSLAELVKQGIDVRYAMIGIGEDQNYLADLARDLGVADRVHMLGHVSLDDLPRWYNACDVFAMPNRAINGDTEGFGMVGSRRVRTACAGGKCWWNWISGGGRRYRHARGWRKTGRNHFCTYTSTWSSGTRNWPKWLLQGTGIVHVGAGGGPNLPAVVGARRKGEMKCIEVY